jgi:hypothetical protein
VALFYILRAEQLCFYVWLKEQNHPIFYLVKECTWYEPFHPLFDLRFCVERNHFFYCLVRHNTTNLVQDFDKCVVKVVSSQILG